MLKQLSMQSECEKCANLLHSKPKTLKVETCLYLRQDLKLGKVCKITY